jgi:hypothetical protein
MKPSQVNPRLERFRRSPRVKARAEFGICFVGFVHHTTRKLQQELARARNYPLGLAASPFHEPAQKVGFLGVFSKAKTDETYLNL